jgi:hypothetical protein
MTIPERSGEPAAEESSQQENLRRLDRAYACYVYIGLFAIALLAVVTVPVPTPDAREGYGMALVLPGTVLPIVFVIAMVLTVRLRHHKSLALLGLSTLFLPLLVFAAGGCCSERVSDIARNVVVGIYGVGAVLVPVWWFMSGRRRYRESLDGDPQ